MAALGGCLHLEKRSAEDHLLTAFPVKPSRLNEAQWIDGVHIFFCNVEGLQAGETFGLTVIEPTAQAAIDQVPRRQCRFELTGFADGLQKPVIIDGTMLAESKESQFILLDFIHTSPVINGTLFFWSEGH